MIFLGLSYAYRGGVFIRVTFLIDRLPRDWRLVADHVSHVLSIAYCLIFRGGDRPAGGARACPTPPR